MSSKDRLTRTIRCFQELGDLVPSSGGVTGRKAHTVILDDAIVHMVTVSEEDDPSAPSLATAAKAWN